jgi:hypothetical protein
MWVDIKIPGVRQRHTIFTTVELIVKDLLGVLLGLLRGVRIIKVSLIATGDLSIGRHDKVWGKFGDGQVFGLVDGYVGNVV